MIAASIHSGLMGAAFMVPVYLILVGVPMVARLRDIRKGKS